jgi:serine/threonine protein kinase
LLFGTTEYDAAIDLWSVGVCFAEFITGKPLLPGKNEFDQIDKTFKLLGSPSEETWPGYASLPVGGATALVTFVCVLCCTLRTHISRSICNFLLHTSAREDVSLEDAEAK